ncbi:uncharacterized protein zgc:174888 [Salvelinus sp. IW2-2015]|uniref:uncharacterized protein zgc:174888 n=1 Tax=Salvelinus sp. IW2-2015 TaxID=2691554 RepID=UPI000CEAD9C6|nr:uncharacterized protein LOC112072291 [Salvelinus alpinus]
MLIACFQPQKWRSGLSHEDKRMSRSVLLLLSILTLQGSGCDDFLREVVKNLQTTLNSDHAGFRKVFPKDYWISHHYNVNLLCNTDPCCVFRAATVLSDSWLQLRSQLWPEHHSFEFISNLIQALDDRGMTKGRFEDPDPSVLPSVSSSPEKLLNFTSSVFSNGWSWGARPRWTLVLPHSGLSCWGGRKGALESKKVRLLTTRAVHRENEGETGMRLHTPPTNRTQHPKVGSY